MSDTFFLAIYTQAGNGRLALYELAADRTPTNHLSVFQIKLLHEPARPALLWQAAEGIVAGDVPGYITEDDGEKLSDATVRRLVTKEKGEALSWLRERNAEHQADLEKLLGSAQAIGFRLTVMDIEEAIADA